jgi:hypothetical protein
LSQNKIPGLNALLKNKGRLVYLSYCAGFCVSLARLVFLVPMDLLAAANEQVYWYQKKVANQEVA